jgi:hypothetical protein
MKNLVLIAGLVALAACGQKQESNVAEEANVALAEPDANAAAEVTPAAFQLNETTWTFTDKDGQVIQESVDASGNYIANAGDKHIDHGTSVMKDGKACFTSAMDKQGEACWTTQPVEIGQSMETTSDKGEKLTVTRVAYVPMSMPKAQ